MAVAPLNAAESVAPCIFCWVEYQEPTSTASATKPTRTGNSSAMMVALAPSRSVRRTASAHKRTPDRECIPCPTRLPDGQSSSYALRLVNAGRPEARLGELLGNPQR